MIVLMPWALEFVEMLAYKGIRWVLCALNTERRMSAHLALVFGHFISIYIILQCASMYTYICYRYECWFG
jgi:hypothetical protein